MTIHNISTNLQHFTHLADQKIWVVSNADKKPIQTNGQAARSNNEGTWNTLREVLKYTREHRSTLPAIVLSSHLNLIFIDLDHVIDPRNGTIQTWAQNIIDKCDSYSEKSRGGEGVHIIVQGHPPNLPSEEKLRCRPAKATWNEIGEFEIYFSKKIATITGDVLVDRPIREISDEEVLELYRLIFPVIKERPSNSSQLKLSPRMDDVEVVKLARSGKNGEKFSQLFDSGEWDQPDDCSAKDLSLANRIAFFTQDAEQIERIMRASALSTRDKWTRADYIPRTIETAIQGLSDTFQRPLPKANDHGAPIQIKLTTKTTGDPFPVACLPKVLREMALEIKRVIKAPLELCCGGVLAAGSIATRGFIKVFEKEELQHYTCFFLMIIAESGERKSSVVKKAMEPIYDFQEEDKERFSEENRTYCAKKKAVSNEEKKVLSEKTTTHEEKARLLEALQTELDTFLPKPYRYITDDFTNPALFRLLDQNRGSFAVMSLDGGNVLDYIQGRGHGTDGALNDSLLLKATWGDPISRDRKGNKDEGEHLFIRNPACHVTIVVQPDRCAEFLADPRLRGSGMIARILPITCTSEIGGRFESEEEIGFDKKIVAEYSKAIQKFFRRMEVLEVRLDEDAAKARRKYFNEVEQEMAIGLSLEDLRDVGSKVATQVTRLAAFFQVYKLNPDEAYEDIRISEKTWYEAEAVGSWIFDQAAHLHRSDYDELVVVLSKEIAEKLHASKLATNPEKPVFCKRDFQQRFKRELKRLGNKEGVNDVLGTLVSHRWIIELPPLQGNWRTPRYAVNHVDGRDS